MKINYSRCEIFVHGIDMVCPLCKKPVEPGVLHSCVRQEKRAGEKVLPRNKP